jgi:capsular polysaccharide biosynthesis protein
VLANGLGVVEMRNLIIGFVLGLIVASVGFSGIARIMDRGVETIKTQSKELAQ